MTPAADHVLLDSLSEELRRYLTAAKLLTLHKLSNLSSPQISVREQNEIADRFEAVTTELVDVAVHIPRTRIVP